MSSADIVSVSFAVYDPSSPLSAPDPHARALFNGNALRSRDFGVGISGRKEIQNPCGTKFGPEGRGIGRPVELCQGEEGEEGNARL